MKLLTVELKRLKYHLILWGLVLVSVGYGIVMAVKCRDLPGGAEFLRAVLSDPTMSVWMCSLLPVVLVGQEFASREVNWFLFSGYRRREYFGIKAAELVVFTGILCGIPLLFMLFASLAAAAAGLLADGFRNAVWFPAAGFEPLRGGISHPRDFGADDIQAAGCRIPVDIGGGFPATAVPPGILL